MRVRSVLVRSMYGHNARMAEAEKEGVDSVEGCEGIIYQVMAGPPCTL